MVPLLLSSAAAVAAPWIDHYACRQINPIPGSDFELFLAVEVRPFGGPVTPIAARLSDLESSTIRIESLEPTRSPEYDLAAPRRDAWHLGEDDIAEYILMLPRREMREIEHGVSVTQVFGGGIAQWSNEFLCQLR
jgi:hypothetical protein